MAELKSEPLVIKEETGDTIPVYLTPDKTPITYNRKLHELTIICGMSEPEAKKYLEEVPIILELFYEMHAGLFGVESEALEQCEIHNPYTGEEIPNDNLI